MSAHRQTVDPQQITVRGLRATADLVVHGGGFAGQTLQVELVKVAGHWKLNEILKFVAMNRLKLLKSLLRQVAREATEAPRLVARCIVELLATSPRVELEHDLLSGSAEPFRELDQSCSENPAVLLGHEAPALYSHAA